VIATIQINIHRPVDDDVKRFYITFHRYFDINSFHAPIMKPIAATARNSTPSWGGVAVRRLDVHLGQCRGQSSFAPSILRTAMPKQNYEDSTKPGEGHA
jgi:hypothetical protein